MSDKEIEEILFAMQGMLKVNPWEGTVPNIFADGMPCAELYEEVYNANRRICERLGDVDEDEDVELIVSNLLRIADIQSAEMFRCGWKFAKENTES